MTKIVSKKKILSEELANKRNATKQVKLFFNREQITPDPKCKQCYGRGYTGFKANTAEPITCACLRKRYNIKKAEYLKTKQISKMVVPRGGWWLYWEKLKTFIIPVKAPYEWSKAKWLKTTDFTSVLTCSEQVKKLNIKDAKSRCENCLLFGFRSEQDYQSLPCHSLCGGLEFNAWLENWKEEEE